MKQVTYKHSLNLCRANTKRMVKSKRDIKRYVQLWIHLTNKKYFTSREISNEITQDNKGCKINISPYKIQNYIRETKLARYDKNKKQWEKIKNE